VSWDIICGMLLLWLEAGLLWYAGPAYSGSAKRMIGYATLVVCLPVLSWPWIAHQGTKARLARADDED